VRITANENIFPLDNLSCHASHFDILPDGALFAVWFHGSKEGADDVCIFGARKDKGDSKWSAPVRLTAEDGIPHWNPVLHLRGDGSVMLFYKTGRKISGWHTEIMISRDGCRSFDATRELVPGDTSGGRGPVRNKVIVLSDGSLLAGGSTEEGEWKCFADRSADNGVTWERGADIRIPMKYLAKYDDINGHGIIQPTLWESAPGRLHMLVRSTEGIIFRSDSGDYGRSWYEPYDIGMINNNSGIDLTCTESGRLYLVCNPVGLGGKKFGLRTPLSVFASDDNGITFEHITEIATGEGTFAYPCVRWDKGKLHITYTWNRRLIQYVCLDMQK
jgi:predicted neuraminidase